MRHFTGKLTRTMPGVMWGVVLLSGAVSLSAPDIGSARDLMTPKEQSNTGDADSTKLPSFDQQKQGVPQSIFVSIHMARGFQEEWDSFGRKGWYTQDPRLKPIDPGTTVFAPDAPAVLELKKPASGNWTKGDYFVKLFIAPLGQQPFHAANQVGTMQFKIIDPPVASGAAK